MSMANIPKYLLLSSLIWRLIRPFAEVIAANTKNTTVDDELIEAVDAVLAASPREMEDAR